MHTVLDAPTGRPAVDPITGGFAERRRENEGSGGGAERRQFGTSRTSFRPEVNELAEAVDRYKLTNRRRFITYEELYDVMIDLGYSRD